MTAKEMLSKTAAVAYDNAIKKIQKAQEEGLTSTYLIASCSCIPKEVTERLLYEGYDVKYHRFNYGDWYIQAYWHDNVFGKVYCEENMSDVRPSSIEEMYSFEG